MDAADPARTVGRRLVGEALGTAFLLAAVVGSGIMGDRLSGGNAGLALLANGIATGAALTVLILTFGPVSGAHLNPAVTLSFASRGELSWALAAGYVGVQVVAALAGVVVAHGMFAEPLLDSSENVRRGGGQVLSEFVATFGLVGCIHACVRRAPAAVAPAVGCYIAAAYWFTASTSFANPAVTAARTVTATFTGIRPADAPAFIGAQVAGALAATLVFAWLVPARRPA